MIDLVILGFMAGVLLGVIIMEIIDKKANKKIQESLVIIGQIADDEIEEKDREIRRLTEAVNDLQIEIAKKRTRKIRLYQCYSCDGIFQKFDYIKDSFPSGDDLLRCPLCGAVEAGATEVEVELK